MHGLQRCFFFAVVLCFGSVFGRSKRIRTNHQQCRTDRNSNRPSRSRRPFPSLLSFLSSVVTTSDASEKSHVAALHRKLSIGGDAEEDAEADDDIQPSKPIPSVKTSVKSSGKSSSKDEGKRDNVGHNASNKIQVAKSKKKTATAATADTTAVRTPSGNTGRNRILT